MLISREEGAARHRVTEDIDSAVFQIHSPQGRLPAKGEKELYASIKTWWEKKLGLLCIVRLCGRSPAFILNVLNLEISDLEPGEFEEVERWWEANVYRGLRLSQLAVLKPQREIF